MGAPIGGTFGAILVVVSIVLGFIFGLTVGAGFLCIAAYIVFALVILTMAATKTPKSSPFVISLMQEDQMVLSMFNLFIITPGAATIYAGVLNVLRLALIVWGGLCIWYGHYWWGGFSLGFFAVTAFHLPRLDPIAYLGPRAAQGHEFSRRQLAAIERIRTRRELFNS